MLGGLFLFLQSGSANKPDRHGFVVIWACEIPGILSIKGLLTKHSKWGFPSKSVVIYTLYVWFCLIAVCFLKFHRDLLWMHCYLIFILSITVRQCHDSRAMLLASQAQWHREFLHYCCILADGDVFNPRLLPSFPLACFSPDTAFLTPLPGALIKTWTNKGRANLLEPPTLDAHSCLGPGAGFGDFSPWQLCWKLAR